MSETRDAFGRLLQQLQAEMRSLRAEQAAHHDALRTFITTLVNTRADATEAYLAEQFERLHRRMDQTERSVEERLAALEAKP